MMSPNCSYTPEPGACSACALSFDVEELDAGQPIRFVANGWRWIDDSDPRGCLVTKSNAFVPAIHGGLGLQ